MVESEVKVAPNFIRDIVKKNLNEGKNEGKVITRFPPEPNGYLHIGHAYAICTTFGVAEEFGGKYNLRFDDTNPENEKTEFVEAIQDDIRWLGFDWEDRLFYASDYFDQLYTWAQELIKKELAYVCDLNDEEIRQYRGTADYNKGEHRETPPGKNSPYRDRSVEENLDLLERMKNGEFKVGEKTLRAKIDMAHPNLNMRDPVMYRIINKEHFRTGTKWCIYPTYDWAHGQSDSIENVTHSICDVGFVSHRALYDWYIEQLGIFPSKQYEFGRMNLTYTVLSKRYLRQLVEEGHVSGWDDPRMPTLRGMRRKGFTKVAIRDFCNRVGVSTKNATYDFSYLEECLRENLNKTADRLLAVLDPVKVVITNYPDGQEEELEAINNPEDEAAGTRMIPFTREIYIEREDFMEDAPRKYFRLKPGGEVRLRYAYYITCTDVIKDADGNITELHCTYDPETKGGQSADGRKVKGTIHWVSAKHAVKAEVRLYDYLFEKENPMEFGEDQTFKDNLNPNSKQVLTECYLEPCLAEKENGYICQFERKGYFCKDQDSRPDKPVYNRTVALKDGWGKIMKK